MTIVGNVVMLYCHHMSKNICCQILNIKSEGTDIVRDDESHAHE